MPKYIKLESRGLNRAKNGVGMEANEDVPSCGSDKFGIRGFGFLLLISNSLFYAESDQVF
jgi:hypothetical protein